MQGRSRRHYDVCELPYCNKPVYVEPATGRQHPFCGKTHAREYEDQRRLMQYQRQQQYQVQQPQQHGLQQQFQQRQQHSLQREQHEDRREQQQQQKWGQLAGAPVRQAQALQTKVNGVLRSVRRGKAEEKTTASGKSVTEQGDTRNALKQSNGSSLLAVVSGSRAGGAGIGDGPGNSQKHPSSFIIQHTPTSSQVSEVRMTDTMILFWKPPCAFTQWEPATFVVGERTYHSAEQYMMSQKARIFKDFNIFEKIMRTRDPAHQKRLGKEVAGFDPDVWDREKVQVVLQGNYAKFTQNPEMCGELLATGDKMLAEASPYDMEWGIGMEADHPNVERHENWPGRNLLGKILMYVRNKIRWEDPELARRPDVQKAMAAFALEYRQGASRPQSSRLI